jgi:hypothetical protein
MKITKEKLTRIIKEEISNVLKEGVGAPLRKPAAERFGPDDFQSHEHSGERSAETELPKAMASVMNHGKGTLAVALNRIVDTDISELTKEDFVNAEAAFEKMQERYGSMASGRVLPKINHVHAYGPHVGDNARKQAAEFKNKLTLMRNPG